MFVAIESKIYNTKKVPMKDNAVFFEKTATVVATEDAKNNRRKSVSI